MHCNAEIDGDFLSKERDAETGLDFQKKVTSSNATYGPNCQIEEGEIMAGQRRFGLIVLIISLLIGIIYAAQDEFPCISREAVRLPYLLNGDTLPGPLFRLQSPDNVNTLYARQGNRTYHGDISTEFFVERAGHRLAGTIDPWANPEAAWSPDSKAFWITSTDGGIVGDWRVQVFFVDSSQIREVDVSRYVRNDLARRFPPCDFKGIPGECNSEERKRLTEKLDWVNVYAFHWIEGSRKLLLVGAVPPSSGYGRNMGRLQGYIVEVPSGKIISVYSEEAFVKTWGKFIGAFTVSK